MSSETASYMKISFVSIYHTTSSFYVFFVLCKKVVIAELEIPQTGHLYGAPRGYVARAMLCQHIPIGGPEPAH